MKITGTYSSAEFFCFDYVSVCNELVYLGGRFGTHRGSFSSPGYPSGTYPSREQCTWIVKVPLNYRVLLHFNDLDVESCPTAMKNCTCDYVTVADGQLLIDKLLAKVCGSTTPPDITSTGSFVRIDLVTDASNSRNFKGFSAQFYSVSQDGSTPTSFDGDAGMHHKTIPPLTDEPGKGNIRLFTLTRLIARDFKQRRLRQEKLQ